MSNYVTRAELEKHIGGLPPWSRVAILEAWDLRRRRKKPWKIEQWRVLIQQARNMGDKAFSARLRLMVAQGRLGYPSGKRLPTAWRKV